MDLEHPEITRTLATGYPHGEPKWPHCPECGQECEYVYVDKHGDVWACDRCVQKKEAWECEHCF